MRQKKQKKEEIDPIKSPQDSSSLKMLERRRFIRHPLCLPLAYKILQPGTSKLQEEIKSETINLSKGGLLFPARRPVADGSVIVIRMPFEDKIFNIKAKVIRCSKNPETSLYDIAATFLRLNQAFKAKMIEQIYLIAEYRDLLSLQVGEDVSLEEASRRWIKRYSARFKRLYW
ncbi:MAG: PilZ domain-containing protein [Candidatus Omnitrophota bacterium]